MLCTREINRKLQDGIESAFSSYRQSGPVIAKWPTVAILAEVRFSTGQQKFSVKARGLNFSAFVHRRRVLHKLALDLGCDVNSVR